MNRPAISLLVILLTVALAGCPKPEVAEKAPPPKRAPAVEKKSPAAAITFELGVLDLGMHKGRIERTDIEKLAAVVRREKIDVLAVQGIARYPGVSTRVDFVDAFSAAAEMRQAFGETADINGRVGGNAIFSIFPIRSSTTTHYTETQGVGFESALQAIVDCGARDVVVVSTRLPDHPDVAVETDAMTVYTNLWSTYVGRPVILCGNLPHSAVMQPPAAYADASLHKGDLPRIWYTHDGALKVSGAKSEPSGLGPIVIMEVAVFPEVKP